MAYTDVILADDPDLYYTFSETLSGFGDSAHWLDHSGKGSGGIGGAFNRASSIAGFADEPAIAPTRQHQGSLVLGSTDYSTRHLGDGYNDDLWAADFGDDTTNGPNTYLRSPHLGFSALIKPSRLSIASTNPYVGWRIAGRMPYWSGEHAVWDFVVNRDGRLELRLWLSLSDDPQDGTEVRCIGATTLQLGQTYHVGANYDGTTAKVFLNGVVDGTLAASGALPTDANARLYIASTYNYHGSGGGPPESTIETMPFTFQGWVDEFAWWRDPLTDTQYADQATAAFEPASVLYQDTFNRANSTNVPGTPTLGGPYTVRAGTWGINNNGLYTSASTTDALITFPGAVDIDFSARAKVVGTSAGLVFRWVDSSNYWRLSWTATLIVLTRRTGGTDSIITQVSRSVAAGDLFRVVAVGRQIVAYHKGRAILSTEDPWASSATATLGFRISTDTTSRIDDAILVPGAFGSQSGDAPLDLTFDGDAEFDSGFIYKGRDTKLADEGAVA